MTYTLRISRPGYNALTDTNIDHFSLYADSDNILIKEHSRGSSNVAGSSTNTITHSLGYIPLVYAQVYNGSEWVWLYGAGIYATYNYYVTTSDLKLVNKTGTTREFKYYIFYDEFT